jgi:hypothetical protein
MRKNETLQAIIAGLDQHIQEGGIGEAIGQLSEQEIRCALGRCQIYREYLQAAAAGITKEFIPDGKAIETKEGLDDLISSANNNADQPSVLPKDFEASFLQSLDQVLKQD